MAFSKSLLCFVAVSLLTSGVHAQPAPDPQQAEFTVRVELDALRESSFGTRLIEAVKAIAAEEFADGIKPEDAFDDVSQALGFDPFDQLNSVAIFGHDMADPLAGMQVLIEMGRTTGNLEGLVLAVPGYQSSRHGEHLIHSVSPDDDVRVHGSIHGDRTKRIVVGTELASVRSMLDALDKGQAVSPSDERKGSQDADAFVTVHLNKIPDIDELEGPPKAVAQMLDHVSASIREGNADHLDINLRLTTSDDKHAEQLQQLTQGLVAMVGLIQDLEEADEELEMIADVVNGLSVDRQGKSVELKLELPESLVVDFLRDEADLPMSR